MAVPIAVLWLLADQLPFAIAVVAALVAATASLGLQVAGRVDRIPHLRRQVPREVPAMGGTAGQFQFGFEVGTGVRTHLTSALPVAAAAAVVLLSPSVWVAVLFPLSFGITRALWPFAKALVRSEEGWSRLAGRVSQATNVGFALVFAVVILEAFNAT